MFDKVLAPSFELVSEQIENTKKENKYPVSVRQLYFENEKTQMTD